MYNTSPDPRSVQAERDLKARERDLEESHSLNSTLRDYMHQQLDTVRELSRQNLDLASRYHAEVLRNSMYASDSAAVSGVATPLVGGTGTAVRHAAFTAPAASKVGSGPLSAAASPPRRAPASSVVAAAEEPRTPPRRDPSAAAPGPAPCQSPPLLLSDLRKPAGSPSSPDTDAGLAGAASLSTSMTSSTAARSPQRASVTARLTREIAELRSELEQSREDHAKALAALERYGASTPCAPNPATARSLGSPRALRTGRQAQERAAAEQTLRADSELVLDKLRSQHQQALEQSAAALLAAEARTVAQETALASLQKAMAAEQDRIVAAHAAEVAHLREHIRFGPRGSGFGPRSLGFGVRVRVSGLRKGGGRERAHWPSTNRGCSRLLTLAHPTTTLLSPHPALIPSPRSDPLTPL